MYRGPEPRKALEPPPHVLFGYIKEGRRVKVHMNQNAKMFIEGVIIGFDEFMNLVLEDACELYTNSDTKVPLGKVLLRGDTIGMVHPVTETYKLKAT